MAERVYTCRDHNDRATSVRIADTKEKLQKILAEAYEGAGDKPRD